jgi:hypothetical protein
VVDGPIAGTGGSIFFTTPVLAASEDFTVLATENAVSGGMNFTGNFTFFDPNDNPSFNNNFTYELWVNPTATRSSNTESTGGTAGQGGQKWALHPSWRGGNGGFGISVGTNGVGVYEHGSGFIPCLLNWNGAISGWTHITVVVENKQPRLYVKGVLVHTGLTSTRANLIPSLGNGGRLAGQIGGIGAGSYGFYEGDMSEFRLWSDIRTPAEITAGMNTCLGGNEDDLYAYYPFTDGTGATQVSDAGPNGLHGSFHQIDENTAWITGTTNSCSGNSCSMALSDTVNVTVNQPTSSTQTLVECQGLSVTVGTNT